MSKTIETRLQSNEVRIPKKTGFDVSSSAAPCQYFKSSFARSLSFNQNGGSPYGGAGQHNHFTRSLDFEVNFGLATIPDQPSSVGSSGSSQTTPSASPVYDPEREGNIKTKLVNGIATSNGGVVKTLWNYSKGSVSNAFQLFLSSFGNFGTVSDDHVESTQFRLARKYHVLGENSSLVHSGSSKAPK